MISRIFFFIFFHLFQGDRIKRLLGMHSETSPDKVMLLNNQLMVQFIRKHIDLQPDAIIDESIDKDKDLLKPGFGTNHCQVKQPGRP